MHSAQPRGVGAAPGVGVKTGVSVWNWVVFQCFCRVFLGFSSVFQGFARVFLGFSSVFQCFCGVFLGFFQSFPGFW